jgi:curli production assembly/transport component CsgF
MPRNALGLAIAVAAAATGMSPGSADEIRFGFTNPSFGGNAFNSAHLLGTAQAQNTHKEGTSLDLSRFSQELRESLNRPETRIVGDTLVRTTTAEDGTTVVDIVNLTTGEVTQVVIP